MNLFDTNIKLAMAHMGAIVRKEEAAKRPHNHSRETMYHMVRRLKKEGVL